MNIAEIGTQLAAGTFTVELFASSGPYVSIGQTPFGKFPRETTSFEGRIGHERAPEVRLSFVAERRRLFPGRNRRHGNDARLERRQQPTSASASSVQIGQPFVQLAGSGLSAPTFNGTKSALVSFALTNTGNIPASAKSAVEFFASTTGTLTGAISLTTTPLHLMLKPHVAHVFKVKLALPVALPAATYTLVALLDPANVFKDPNAATNFIVSGNMFTVA